MSIVEIVRSSSPNSIEPRDLIIIDGEAYIAAGVDTKSFKLISLEDGNRWDDREFSINMSFEEFVQYAQTFEDNSTVEFIKHHDYKIRLEIS